MKNNFPRPDKLDKLNYRDKEIAPTAKFLSSVSQKIEIQKGKPIISEIEVSMDSKIHNSILTKSILLDTKKSVITNQSNGVKSRSPDESELKISNRKNLFDDSSSMNTNLKISILSGNQSIINGMPNEISNSIDMYSYSKKLNDKSGVSKYILKGDSKEKVKKSGSTPPRTREKSRSPKMMVGKIIDLGKSIDQQILKVNDTISEVDYTVTDHFFNGTLKSKFNENSNENSNPLSNTQRGGCVDLNTYYSKAVEYSIVTSKNSNDKTLENRTIVNEKVIEMQTEEARITEYDQFEIENEKVILKPYLIRKNIRQSVSINKVILLERKIKKFLQTLKPHVKRTPFVYGTYYSAKEIKTSFNLRLISKIQNSFRKYIVLKKIRTTPIQINKILDVPTWNKKIIGSNELINLKISSIQKLFRGNLTRNKLKKDINTLISKTYSSKNCIFLKSYQYIKIKSSIKLIQKKIRNLLQIKKKILGKHLISTQPFMITKSSVFNIDSYIQKIQRFLKNNKAKSKQFQKLVATDSHYIFFDKLQKAPNEVETNLLLTIDKIMKPLNEIQDEHNIVIKRTPKPPNEINIESNLMIVHNIPEKQFENYNKHPFEVKKTMKCNHGNDSIIKIQRKYRQSLKYSKNENIFHYNPKLVPITIRKFYIANSAYLKEKKVFAKELFNNIKKKVLDNLRNNEIKESIEIEMKKKLESRIKYLPMRLPIHISKILRLMEKECIKLKKILPLTISKSTFQNLKISPKLNGINQFNKELLYNVERVVMTLQYRIKYFLWKLRRISRIKNNFTTLPNIKLRLFNTKENSTQKRVIYKNVEKIKRIYHRFIKREIKQKPKSQIETFCTKENKSMKMIANILRIQNAFKKRLIEKAKIKNAKFKESINPHICYKQIILGKPETEASHIAFKYHNYIIEKNKNEIKKIQENDRNKKMTNIQNIEEFSFEHTKISKRIHTNDRSMIAFKKYIAKFEEKKIKLLQKFYRKKIKRNIIKKGGILTPYSSSKVIKDISFIMLLVKIQSKFRAMLWKKNRPHDIKKFKKTVYNLAMIFDRLKQINTVITQRKALIISLKNKRVRTKSSMGWVKFLRKLAESHQKKLKTFFIFWKKLIIMGEKITKISKIQKHWNQYKSKRKLKFLKFKHFLNYSKTPKSLFEEFFKIAKSIKPFKKFSQQLIFIEFFNLIDFLSIKKPPQYYLNLWNSNRYYEEKILSKIFEGYYPIKRFQYIKTLEELTKFKKTQDLLREEEELLFNNRKFHAILRPIFLKKTLKLNISSNIFSKIIRILKFVCNHKQKIKRKNKSCEILMKTMDNIKLKQTLKKLNLNRKNKVIDRLFKIYKIAYCLKLYLWKWKSCSDDLKFSEYSRYSKSLYKLIENQIKSNIRIEFLGKLVNFIFEKVNIKMKVKLYLWKSKTMFKNQEKKIVMIQKFWKMHKLRKNLKDILFIKKALKIAVLNKPFFLMKNRKITLKLNHILQKIEEKSIKSQIKLWNLKAQCIKEKLLPYLCRKNIKFNVKLNDKVKKIQNQFKLSKKPEKRFLLPVLLPIIVSKIITNSIILIRIPLLNPQTISKIHQSVFLNKKALSIFKQISIFYKLKQKKNKLVNKVKKVLHPKDGFNNFVKSYKFNYEMHINSIKDKIRKLESIKESLNKKELSNTIIRSLTDNMEISLKSSVIYKKNSTGISSFSKYNLVKKFSSLMMIQLNIKNFIRKLREKEAKRKNFLNSIKPKIYATNPVLSVKSYLMGFEELKKVASFLQKKIREILPKKVVLLRKIPLNKYVGFQKILLPSFESITTKIQSIFRGFKLRKNRIQPNIRQILSPIEIRKSIRHSLLNPMQKKLRNILSKNVLDRKIKDKIKEKILKKIFSNGISSFSKTTLLKNKFDYENITKCLKKLYRDADNSIKKRNQEKKRENFEKFKKIIEALRDPEPIKFKKCLPIVVSKQINGVIPETSVSKIIRNFYIHKLRRDKKLERFELRLKNNLRLKALNKLKNYVKEKTLQDSLEKVHDMKLKLNCLRKFKLIIDSEKEMIMKIINLLKKNKVKKLIQKLKHQIKLLNYLIYKKNESNKKLILSKYIKLWKKIDDIEKIRENEIKKEKEAEIKKTHENRARIIHHKLGKLHKMCDHNNRLNLKNFLRLWKKIAEYLKRKHAAELIIYLLRLNSQDQEKVQNLTKFTNFVDQYIKQKKIRNYLEPISKLKEMKLNQSKVNKYIHHITFKDLYKFLNSLKLYATLKDRFNGRIENFISLVNYRNLKYYLRRWKTNEEDFKNLKKKSELVERFLRKIELKESVRSCILLKANALKNQKIYEILLNIHDRLSIGNKFELWRVLVKKIKNAISLAKIVEQKVSNKMKETGFNELKDYQDLLNNTAKLHNLLEKPFVNMNPYISDFLERLKICSQFKSHENLSGMHQIASTKQSYIRKTCFERKIQGHEEIIRVKSSPLKLSSIPFLVNSLKSPISTRFNDLIDKLRIVRDEKIREEKERQRIEDERRIQEEIERLNQIERLKKEKEEEILKLKALNEENEEKINSLNNEIRTKKNIEDGLTCLKTYLNFNKRPVFEELVNHNNCLINAKAFKGQIRNEALKNFYNHLKIIRNRIRIIDLIFTCKAKIYISARNYVFNILLRKGLTEANNGKKLLKYIDLGSENDHLQTLKSNYEFLFKNPANKNFEEYENLVLDSANKLKIINLEKEIYIRNVYSYNWYNQDKENKICEDDYIQTNSESAKNIFKYLSDFVVTDFYLPIEQKMDEFELLQDPYPDPTKYFFHDKELDFVKEIFIVYDRLDRKTIFGKNSLPQFSENLELLKKDKEPLNICNDIEVVLFKQTKSLFITVNDHLFIPKKLSAELIISNNQELNIEKCQKLLFKENCVGDFEINGERCKCCVKRENDLNGIKFQKQESINHIVDNTQKLRKVISRDGDSSFTLYPNPNMIKVYKLALSRLSQWYNKMDKSKFNINFIQNPKLVKENNKSLEISFSIIPEYPEEQLNLDSIESDKEETINKIKIPNEVKVKDSFNSSDNDQVKLRVNLVRKARKTFVPPQNDNLLNNIGKSKSKKGFINNLLKDKENEIAEKKKENDEKVQKELTSAKSEFIIPLKKRNETKLEEKPDSNIINKTIKIPKHIDAVILNEIPKSQSKNNQLGKSQEDKIPGIINPNPMSDKFNTNEIARPKIEEIKDSHNLKIDEDKKKEKPLLRNPFSSLHLFNNRIKSNENEIIDLRFDGVDDYRLYQTGSNASPKNAKPRNTEGNFSPQKYSRANERPSFIPNLIKK